MSSIYSCAHEAQRPADITPEQDWFQLADDVFQGEVNIGFRHGHDHTRVVADALAQVANVTALLEQLLAVRADAVEVAYAAGATPEQVAAAMGLDNGVGHVLVGGAR